MTQSKPLTASIIGITLLVLVGVAFLSLGKWQLSRADERIAIAAAIESGRTQPPIKLDKNTPEADVIDWRSAQVDGKWAVHASVLLDNRNLDGRPGYWLATPLINSDGSAVLVLRGWLPRVLGPVGGVASNMTTATRSPQDRLTETAPATTPLGVVLPSPKPPVDGLIQVDLHIDTPDGFEQVTGEMTSHVPRLYELGKAPSLQLAPASAFSSNGVSTQVDLRQLPVVQNLELDTLKRVSGLTLLPVVLKQTSDTGDGLIRQWAGPSIDSDKNMGYAMQWFAFAAIALVAAGVLGWRTLKRAKI